MHLVDILVGIIGFLLGVMVGIIGLISYIMAWDTKRSKKKEDKVVEFRNLANPSWGKDLENDSGNQ